MEDSKAMTTSMSTTKSLVAYDEGEHMDQKEYRSMIVTTRPGKYRTIA
jgi:hypothetical protein